ncbi:MAG: epoxyqueuosine reductase QueH [Candidatus Colwellbacteria bacterium]|nr:epoxyqueuosine reductase QueH [Candidatus Colwellbacteria bacterium]
MAEMSEKLLMHTCCAICASEVTVAMKAGYDPIAFFSNPNIYPEDEYIRRRDAMRLSAKKNDILLFEDHYDRNDWLKNTSPFANEPEGGKRCALCFALRLRRTADFAAKKGINKFTTTLSASPYKDEVLIREIGRKIAEEKGLIFIDPIIGRDKKTAWDQAMKMTREEGYYRQRYCGCEYSIRPSANKG